MEMSNHLELPNIQNIPYPNAVVPRDTKGAIDAITKIMDIDLVPETPRNEDTLILLCGVLLYRHIDRFQKMKIMEMLYDRSIIAPIDGAELHDLIVGTLVQPRWHLWSLSTEELGSILKGQKVFKDLLTLLGIGVSVSSGGSFVKEVLDEKRFGKAGVLFVFALIAHYAIVNQYNNSAEEMERRTPKPLSSSYY